MTGHLDATYAADLRARSIESRESTHAGTDVAFLSTPWSRDGLSERLGESFVALETGGEDEEDVRDEVVTEEIGGPFVETDGEIELAAETDGSNPEGATREPFPRA